jgi:hypothetical protein
MKIINISIPDWIIYPAILLILLFKLGAPDWGQSSIDSSSTETLQKRIELLSKLPNLNEHQREEYSQLELVLRQRSKKEVVVANWSDQASLYSVFAFLAAIAVLFLLYKRPKTNTEADIENTPKEVPRDEFGAWLATKPVRDIIANFSTDIVEINGYEVIVRKRRILSILALIFMAFGCFQLFIKYSTGSAVSLYLMPFIFMAIGGYLLYLSLYSLRINKTDLICEYGVFNKKSFKAACAQSFKVKSAGVQNVFRFSRTQIVLEGQDGRAVLASVEDEREIANALVFLDLPIAR